MTVEEFTDSLSVQPPLGTVNTVSLESDIALARVDIEAHFVAVCRQVKRHATIIQHIFQHLPVGVEHSMRYMLDAEVRNAERKRQLMARAVPGRVGISPEDYLAANAKYIAENGKLPLGDHSARDGIITSGTFKVVPTSPFRSE